jgi:hypothetical protein
LFVRKNGKPAYAEDYLHSLHNFILYVETRKLFLPSRFQIGKVHFSKSQYY